MKSCLHRRTPWWARGVIASGAAVLLLLLSAGCERPPVGGQAIAHATLEEVQRRAAPWSSHLTVEPAFGGGVGAYLLRGLLTKEEVDQLVSMAERGMGIAQEIRSQHHAAINVERLPERNTSAVLALVDERLAALSGLPRSHIEEGYFSVYNAGHELRHLHLDNHHAVMSPRRLLGFVVYLLGEGEGLGGGGTVFPLAPSGAAESWQLGAERLAAWSASLRSAADFRPGEEDPQQARTCDWAPRSPRDPCTTVVKMALSVCGAAAAADGERDLGRGLVRARAGDAIMFHQLDEAGRETHRTMHGSCGVDSGDKVVLAKFVRGGPGPWTDGEAYREARLRWQAAGQRRSAAKGEL